jgi:hypothetical protein
MHLPGQRASRCPQEDDLFRPSVAAIFVGVAWNPLVQHLSGRAFMAMLRWSSLGQLFGQLTSPSGAFFDWHRLVNDPFDGFDSELFGAIGECGGRLFKFSSWR